MQWMKKIVVIFVIIIAILGSICYIYSQKKITENKKIANYDKYKTMLNKEFAGTDVASLINESIDKNKSNNVEDNNGLYIDNNENTFIIEIKFLDADSLIRGEKIYLNGVQRFVDLYGTAKFKCTKVEFHKKTHEIKYLCFEEEKDNQENTEATSY